MRVPVSLLFLLASLLAHGLAARWVLARLPRLRSSDLGRATVWGMALLLAVTPTTARVMAWRSASPWVVRLLAASALEMFAMTLTVAVLGLVALAWRLSRRLRRIEPPGPAAPSDVPAEPETTAAADAPLGRRAAIERLAGVSVYGATVTAFGWGMVRGRHAFVTEEVVVRVAGWPRALDGYVIAQVSDIHVGAFIGERELDAGLELVRRLRPDLVVATGDLVDFVSDSADPLARALASIDARDGAVAILGNHDHYAGPEDVIARLRRGGVRVLHNQGLHLRGADGGGFALLGVDDLQGRRLPRPGFAGPDLGRALADVPPDAPRILLAHQPRYFREAAGRVALQLSGHTHGGQIRPLTTPVTAFMEFVEGRYEREGSTLWVNRGFGTSGPPSRVGSPPEITKIVIVSG